MSIKAQFTEMIQAEFVVVGVDSGKHKQVAVAASEDGRRAKAFTFDTSLAGFESLLRYAADHQRASGCRGFVVAMEPTSHYCEPLAQWLTGQGIDVYSVPALKTKRAKELYDGTWRKTDAKDAWVVADLCRRGFGQTWRVHEEPYATLRVLGRRREQLITERTRILARLHRHRDVLFPELSSLPGRIDGRAMRWLPEHAPTPKQILELGPKRLADKLFRASHHNWGRKRAAELVALASHSVGIERAVDAHRLSLRQLLEELAFIDNQLKQLEAEMERRVADVPYAKHLRTIPRFSAVVVATLLGELGDLRGYRVARQVLKMAGLDLVEASSGERNGERHISRRGRPTPRRLLFLIALCLGRTQSGFGARRQRLVETRHKPPLKAAIGNICALLRIAHALARDQVDFDPTRHLPLPDAGAPCA